MSCNTNSGDALTRQPDSRVTNVILYLSVVSPHFYLTMKNYCQGDLQNYLLRS